MRRIEFTAPAREDVRRIDRDTAIRILTAPHRFAETGEGDIKKMQGESNELRLRVGDHRVRFTKEGGDVFTVHAVKHCRDAYR
jgi:mRNA interferase RelE/StbE